MVRCLCPTDTNRRRIVYTFYFYCIASAHVMVGSIDRKCPPHCQDLVDNQTDHRIQSGKKIKSTAENFNFPIAINQRSLSTKCVSRYLQISWRREWQDLRNYIIPMIGQFHCAIVIGRFRIFPFTPIIDFRWTNPIIAHCVH